MIRCIQIIIILCFLTGCAGPLKQNWNNFTAYYNTFYNANQYYSEGLKRNTDQVPEINPEIPLRVHLPPSSAGQEEFSRAIEGGASILRNHENSKYVAQALFLIGKSYYYRLEYFSALEKFQELQAVGNSIEVQEAILWQGKSYLEMETVNEGIYFLENELSVFSEWNPSIQSEIKVVLAQLYSEQEDWETAVAYLSDSLNDIENPDIQARAFFLRGQLHEKLGEYENALFAYSQIKNIRTDYDVEFNALRKEAEVSRQLGSFQRAIELYSSIERDDKFIEYRDELNYEIGRSYQLKGDTGIALQSYNRVLQNRMDPPSELVKAKTYFGLAELYRFDFEDFNLAAAYYDSAANIRVDSERLPGSFNANELADSFGEYSTIKNEINRLDSLMYLGSLEPAAFDSVINEIQQAQALEREMEMQRVQERQNQLIITEDPDSITDAAEETEYGFLNVNNADRQQNASLQFQAIWGDRPLADNWRRRTDVSGSRFDEPIVLTESSGEQTTVQEQRQISSQTGIDVSHIPFSEEDRMQTQDRIEELHYRLGNVFFLSMEMPDSAKVYYRRVVDQSAQDRLVSRSLYSLAEIERLSGNMEEAEKWFEILIDRYPNSEFAIRASEQFGYDHSRQVLTDSVPMAYRYMELSASDSVESSAQRAAELQDLANEDADSSQRPLLLYEAALLYIEAAKLGSGTPAVGQMRDELYENDRMQELDQFALNDSAEVMNVDTSFTGNEQQYFQNFVDSTLAEQDFESWLSFEGVYWDSARSVLHEIETAHSSSEIIPRIQALKETLEKSNAETGVMNQDIEGEEVIQGSESEEHMYCSELASPVNIEGRMDNFISNVSFPEWTQEISMRGELEYLMVIHPDGSVQEYEQISRMDRSGIPQAYEQAIEEYLQFEPTGYNEFVKCIMTFPVNI